MSKLVPTLDYDCTTVGFKRQTSIALPLFAGASGHWLPTRVFGLKIIDQGTFDPGGPPGHSEFDVFTCRVESCYIVGFAYFSRACSTSSPALAHIRVLAPSNNYGTLGDAEAETGADAEADAEAD